MDMNALYAAAIAGDAEAIAKLEMEADRVNGVEGTILHTESWKGKTEHVRFILSEFADKKLLVKRDVDERTALHYAAEWRRAEVVEVLIDAARRSLPSSSSAADNDPHHQLISSFEAFVRHADRFGNTALHVAVSNICNTAIVKLLVAADPSDKHIQNNDGKTPIYIAVERGCIDIVNVICTTCTALSFDGPHGTTALHAAINNMDKAEENKRDVVIELINAAKRWSSSDDEPHGSFVALFYKTDNYGKTVLDVAVEGNYPDLVKLILEEDPAYQPGFGSQSKLNHLMLLCYRAADSGYDDILKVLFASFPYIDPTPMPLAIRGDHKDADADALYAAAIAGDAMAIANLEMEADRLDAEEETILHKECWKGNLERVRFILSTIDARKHLLVKLNKKEQTALHKASRNFGSAKVVEVLIDSARRNLPYNDDPHNQLISSFEAFVRHADRNGNTALHTAVILYNVPTVKLLVEADPSDKHIQNNDGKTPIYIAAEEGYTDIVNEICITCTALSFDGPDGRTTALHAAIKKMDHESVFSILGCDKHLVKCLDRAGWTPLHYAASQEFDSVLEAIIKAQDDVGFKYLYEESSSPLHVAAENGYTSTVIRLAQLWPVSRSYVAVNKEGRNILHLAAVQSKKEMIQAILKNCPEKFKEEIVNRQDRDGNTPLHLLISNGCFVPKLLKYYTKAKNKRGWTPRDLLYFEDQIIAEQVKIKIALDDIQTNKYWKFWSKSAGKKMEIWRSVVLPSKRVVLPSKQKAKDVLFEDAKKKLIDEKHTRIKKGLERYKKRTTTQIIVTALITTVTFTVGFTMPGGLHQSGELDQGLVLLSKKKAFNAFVVSDALALLLSTSSLFLYFLESMYEDPQQVSKINAASTGLNIVSIMAMMLTFITGTYVVLSHSPALANTVCLIGSFFFLFVIVLLIKMVYDRQVERNEE